MSTQTAPAPPLPPSAQGLADRMATTGTPPAAPPAARPAARPDVPPFPFEAQQAADAALQACDRSDHAAIDAQGPAAVDAARAAGRDDLACAVLAAWSQSAYRRNDAALAARLAAQALETGQRSACPVAQAEGQVAWARILWSSGELAEALTALEQALPVAQRPDGPARLRVQAFNLIGLVHADLDRLEASAAYHQAALQAAEAAGVADLQLMAVTNLAGRWLALGKRLDGAGDAAGARQTWLRVLALVEPTEALVRRHGLAHGLPHLLATVGATLLRLGRVEEGLQVLARQRAIVQGHPDRTSLVHAALHLARHHRRHGDLARARQAVQAGLLEAGQHGAKARLAELHLLASEIDEASGCFEPALAHHKRFHALREACAVERAQLKSTLLAVRLQTEQALQQADAERSRARQLAQAHADLQLQAHRLAEQARRDGLTGLLNRRALDELLPGLHARALADGTPLHGALIDADHFKAINDRFGHATGDRVLCAIATLLRSQARDTDQAARYGGEEFVLLLPGADGAAARSACERLRAAVQGHDWAALQPGLVLSISIGLADLARSVTPAAGLAQADQALYRAKAQGRNRVCGP